MIEDVVSTEYVVLVQHTRYIVLNMYLNTHMYYESILDE
jgi:hypothetical protein